LERAILELKKQLYKDKNGEREITEVFNRPTGLKDVSTKEIFKAKNKQVDNFVEEKYKDT
jgi:hypothetical protein